MRTFSKIAAWAAFMVFAGSGLFSSPASAFPTKEEMQQNFQTCVSSDSTWYRRFGQYIVAFDIYDATTACRQAGSPQRSQLAACSTSGGWIYAGYYCEDSYKNIGE